MSGRNGRHRLVHAAWCGLGAVVGLVVAFVITLNLHIWVGLEQGYAATPAQVFDASVVLGVVDIALALLLSALGAVTVHRARQ